MEDSEKHAKPLFHDLTGDDSDPEIMEIESLCLNCRENGITKMLLTKIPFYKEVVVMSFFCEHCKWQNNELQPAAKIQEKGVKFKLNVIQSKDLTRQVVKTKYASIVIPEIEFEIPSGTQEGTVTTIEGILQRAYEGIHSKLRTLKKKNADSATKLEDFLKKLSELKEGNMPFTFVLQDSSGNSFLENFNAPNIDPAMEVTYFTRSKEEDMMLGIEHVDIDDDTVTEASESAASAEANMKAEVLTFPTNCPICNAPCVTNMKMTHIPHFRDVIIMATICDACGHKTNEVKSNSGIEPYGVKISLSIESDRDLKRDILKSDTCDIIIPEVDLEVGSAAFTGRYTTVEGILTIIKEQLLENNPLIGDSARKEVKERLENFIAKIEEIIQGKRKVTLILDDPCGNSYLEGLDSPCDENLRLDKYERTFQQNEELGLNDMKVENYEES